MKAILSRFEIYQKEFYLKNRTRILARIKLWKANNKEVVSLYNKRWRQSHKEKCAAHSRAYRKRHPEKYKESYSKTNKRPETRIIQKRHRDKKYKENPRYYLDKTTAWRLKNPERWNVFAAKSKKKRYWNNVNFRMQQLVSGAISKATKKNGTIKTKRTLELLGCSALKLRSHLESKFRGGMSWDNMGKRGWHIDHVKPCASFNLKIPQEQEKCFHFTNLQPLWWRDNLSKGAKIL